MYTKAFDFSFRLNTAPVPSSIDKTPMIQLFFYFLIASLQTFQSIFFFFSLSQDQEIANAGQHFARQFSHQRPAHPPDGGSGRRVSQISFHGRDADEDLFIFITSFE